jgi:2-hydroxy-5-methyl-1-naphthoate 7-hydroxylase
MAAEVPEFRLDPAGSDHHGEAARLREAGPVVRVILPGEVRVFAITRHAELEAFIKDPRVSASYRNWSAWKDGQVTPDWPLYGMVAVDNMFTADGDHHRRLRRPVTRVLTARKVEAMRPAIAGIATGLLDELPGRAGPDGVVELRQHYAYPLPMTVVSGLVMGMPREWWPQLRALVEGLFRTDGTAEEAAAIERDRVRLLGDLIALRTGDPGDDLTSDLIRDRRDHPEPMTDTELADTLWIMLTAGHETTLSLITNAVRAVLTHRAQRDLAGGWGDAAWSALIEEVLRWDTPVGNLMAGYVTEDIDIAGTTIPAGEAVLAAYSAAGRDPAHYGPDAGLLDVTRAQNGHLAFGAGSHSCPGALLARTEARVALPALFGRYPELALAVGPDEVRPVPSFFTNSAWALPVRLAPGPGAASSD